jgi:hypothetical protein
MALRIHGAQGFELLGAAVISHAKTRIKSEDSVQSAAPRAGAIED